MTFGCGICGSAGTTPLRRMNRTGKPGIWACPDHLDRTKCSIDGCRRSTKRDAGRPLEWICSAHWRRYCPPRSLKRRAYLAFFRRARRHGWTDDLSAKYWQFWDTLTRRANAIEARSAFDTTEINKLFGWDDEG